MTIILKHQNLATEFINYDAITKKHILPKNRKLRVKDVSMVVLNVGKLCFRGVWMICGTVFYQV